jgi:hypothetical protein
MLSSGNKLRKKAMSKRTTLEDGVQIAALAEAGLSDPQIAERTGWSLHMELGKGPRFIGQPLPAASSIGRFLRAEALSRSYEKHNDLPEPARQPAEAPHDVWEMDARGHSKAPDVGVVSLVNLNDRCSHARLLSCPVEGLTVDALMGTMATYINLPLFQLALPFEWTDLQPVRLFETIPA